MVKTKILSTEEEEEENNRWIQSKMKKTRKRPFTIEKTRGVYDMSSETRGWCLIFSNHVFKHLGKLLGYERDKENFAKVFTELHFKVKIFEKVTAQEMKDNIEKYAKISASDGLHPTNALVVVILSHGSDNFLCGVNFSSTDQSDKISVAEMKDIVSNQNCPYLIGKPKLFFLQACRGNRIDLGLNNDFTPKIKMQDVKTTPIATTLRSGKELYYNEMDRKISTLPSAVEDMKIFYATSSSYASYVPLSGSLFGVELCVHLKRYAWQRDLNDIMLSVNSALRSKDIVIGGKNIGKQVLEMRYISPTKKLYFNPGYFKSNTSTSTSVASTSASVASTSAASSSHIDDVNHNARCEQSNENVVLPEQPIRGPNENIENDENAEPQRKTRKKQVASLRKPIHKGVVLVEGQTKIQKYFRTSASDSKQNLSSTAKHE